MICVKIPLLKRIMPMQSFIQSAFQIGTLTLNNRLIQGPLAGYSCAAFRKLFYRFTPAAYCVSEMISAHDVIHKHTSQSRYLFRDPAEKTLCYQLAGKNPSLMADAASRLESIGADLIDINCGCPKEKIRKKGLGSALLEESASLIAIIDAIKRVIQIPLTVKIRIQGSEQDILLAQEIEQAGADALIVHGRRWYDDYDVPCDFAQIGRIKQSIHIPVIANGDIATPESLDHAIAQSQCDAYMIARAGCGKPWIYQDLLHQTHTPFSKVQRFELFMSHIQDLALLENEYKAILQSRALLRYYFKHELDDTKRQSLYQLTQLDTMRGLLKNKLGID